jgi:hypothetical protein
MTSHPATQNHKSMLHKWFGPNRGTHWTIAGSVIVIMLGGYLVYSNRDVNPPTTASVSSAPAAPAPVTPTK